MTDFETLLMKELKNITYLLAGNKPAKVLVKLNCLALPAAEPGTVDVSLRDIPRSPGSCCCEPFRFHASRVLGFNEAEHRGR